MSLWNGIKIIGAIAIMLPYLPFVFVIVWAQTVGFHDSAVPL